MKLLVADFSWAQPGPLPSGKWTSEWEIEKQRSSSTVLLPYLATQLKSGPVARNSIWVCQVGSTAREPPSAAHSGPSAEAGSKAEHPGTELIPWCWCGKEWLHLLCHIWERFKCIQTILSAPATLAREFNSRLGSHVLKVYQCNNETSIPLMNLKPPSNLTGRWSKHGGVSPKFHNQLTQWSSKIAEWSAPVQSVVPLNWQIFHLNIRAIHTY